MGRASGSGSKSPRIIIVCSYCMAPIAVYDTAGRSKYSGIPLLPDRCPVCGARLRKEIARVELAARR